MALMISGPFTIFNVLIDPKYVFKAMRKQPELMRDIFQKIERELLSYIKIAVEYGVDMISYADSSGGVNILGPKMAGQICFFARMPCMQELMCSVRICRKKRMMLSINV